MRILITLTVGSAGRPSRLVSLDQIIEAYRILQASGIEVVIASSRSESPSVRGSGDRSRTTSSIQRIPSDRRARDAINDPLKFEQIHPEDFDGAISISALDEPADPHDAEVVLSLFKALLAAGKPVAIVPNELELEPLGVFEGLLITGNGMRAPSLATKAVLAALSQSGR